MRLCSLLLALAVPAAAQVPDGWIVASTFRDSLFPLMGTGGIWIVHPTLGTKIPITNLPPEVTGARWPNSRYAGTDFILRRPADGALMTDGWGPAGQDIQFLVLRLVGTRVVATDRYSLGTVTDANGTGAPQASLMPDGRVLVAVDRRGVGRSGEPLDGAILGIIDTAIPPSGQGAVTAIRASTNPPGNVNAMAYDAQNKLAYVAVVQGPVMNWTTTIYRIAVPAGGALTQEFNYSGTARSLLLDNQGRLVVGTGHAISPLLRYDFTTKTLSPIALATASGNAVTIERPTGDLIVFDSDVAIAKSTIYRVPASGSPTILATAPAGGWGVSAGLDLNQNLEPYGHPTAGSNTYSWNVWPNAGGMPRVGNASFSVSISSTPAAPTASVLLIDSSRSRHPVPLPGLGGIELFLGFTALQIVPIFPSSQTMQVGLPIPNQTSLSGLNVFLQSVHDEGGRYGCTSGLELTIM